MERDMRLIYKIVDYIGNQRHQQDATTFEVVLPIPEFTEKQVDYHLGLCIDAGLVRGDINLRGKYFWNRLTWKGYNFLEASPTSRKESI